ncbi:hypothetical protein AYL99_07864 [Fonsecaea erecta]|uniref:Uncharacterized protein n=1 Tax=Fonsecaea erecta TaxID=1367422 RepID=A0A178ZBG9_9EURO|nr:hypothetical protein AYL99_07864 [Fonsecaea erecta]OAP57127.1 hypothetical protein AYL99_07864 [Fonsecaea erecta]
MSLRNAVKELRRGTSRRNLALPSGTGSSGGIPYLQSSIAEDVDACPAYHPAIPSRTEPVDADPFHNLLEDTHDSDLDSEEAPPPYMKLSNGDRKPEYSRYDPAQTTDANLSRMDGALCLRCNARKAKAWYLRQTVRPSQ